MIISPIKIYRGIVLRQLTGLAACREFVVPLFLRFAVMYELDPLSNLQIVDGIDSHISFAGIASCDLVNRCL